MWTGHRQQVTKSKKSPKIAQDHVLEIRAGAGGSVRAGVHLSHVHLVLLFTVDHHGALRAFHIAVANMAMVQE